MNAGGQQTPVASTNAMYLQVLKEPRGLIRVIQWIFSIFAFSTTAGFWTEIKLSTPKCNAVTMVFTYPFKIQNVNNCPDVDVVGDMSTQAEYFVAVGVLTFLYCIGIVLLYFFFEPLYQSNALVPIIDFGMTAIFTIFWLTSSAAWAQGVSDLKFFTDPNELIGASTACSTTSSCTVITEGSYATLNVSLIFGFANFALWAASLWFIYKETEWFKQRNPVENGMGNNPT